MVESIDPHEHRRLSDAMDRLEERLAVAPKLLHSVGRPANASALAGASLPASVALFWAHYDGVRLFGGEAELFRVEDVQSRTEAARHDGVPIESNDLVIGEQGRSLWIIPADPWAEGAEVVRIDDDGEREPEASSVPHLVLGVLLESSVLYDDAGEFRDDVIDEWGELESAAQRRLYRRRLDADPDAPRSRRDLARVLRQAGERRAARSELQQVLRRAPEWSQAHHELGLTLEAMGQTEAAWRAFVKAAEFARDPVVAANDWAHAARAASEAKDRQAAARNAVAARPDFASHQATGARARLALDDLEMAREMIELGLAVAPTNLTLLDLKRGLS